ncbi:hypothetical protein OG911_28115 [Streptomyces sp. NBC_00208]|uniref:hypothetical protein n=1 Tax=Streptomyces sp. NBC_00208 TaxID=2975681 RepID=UPI002E2BDC8E|nr:hypothetical protein [Streptomyces sp. NBC_00208]
MTTTLLAYSPAYAIAGLLFLAVALCRRLTRWHTRRDAAVAEWQARPCAARLGAVTTEGDRAA